LVASGRLVGLDGGDAGPTPARDGDPAWSGLVSAALLGTERTGGTISVPAAAASLVGEREPERAILAAAGILAVRRRAGRQPEADPSPAPEPAPEDPRPMLPPEPARLFGVTVTDEPGLLPEVLDLLRRSGRRPPDEWLPALLAAAGRNPDVRAAGDGLLGPRARWLAAAMPELSAGVTPEPPADWDAAWDDARGGTQRAALVRAMRGADAVAGRELVATRLPDLPGDERAPVVEALDAALGPDDEPVLAAALGDRRADVRRVAAGLLARLEGSALTRMLEGRARPLLASKGLVRQSLAVTLPTLDAELEAAGFGGRASGGLGERSWLLRQLLAHVRPARWAAWLGAKPDALVERALRSDEARPVLEGWIEAAARFEDVPWLGALLGEPKVGQTATVDLARAVAGLPGDRRLAVVAVAASALDPVTLARLAGACLPPWPRSVGDALLEAARSLASNQYPDPALYELVRAAARGLPPDRADDLVAIASWEGQPRPALGAAIDTIRLRGRIRAAFEALPPAGASINEGEP
jgi:hypothetical protein